MDKRVLIVYFSGTGGTRLAAESFEGAFRERGCQEKDGESKELFGGQGLSCSTKAKCRPI